MAVRRLLGLYFATFLGLFLLSARRLLDLAPAGVPLALWSPFLEPLFSAACEMALLVSIPAAALCARASLLTPRFTLLAAILLTVPTLTAAVMLDTSSAAPGRVAQELIDAARTSCPDSAERRVPVPLLPMTWSCPSKSAPVASGSIPFGPKVTYHARSIQLSADLRRIDIDGLDIAAPAAKAPFGLRIRAERARLLGLSPWGRPRDLSGSGRFLRSAATGIAMVLAGLALFARRPINPWSAAAVGLAAGLGLVVLQNALDRRGVPGSTYWLGLLLGPLAVIGLGLLAAAVERRTQRAVARREA